MDPIPSKEPPSLAADMADLAALVRSCGPEFKPAADRLEALLGRLDEGSFHLAVLGQFKRGKSTLLNALLGEAVLPSSVVPLTAIPTRIRSGPVRHVRVDFSDGKSDEVSAVPDAAALAAVLARYVTEEANPGNRLAVAEVEVLHPSPALAHGVVLIDTPGIGSTYAHNTATTMAFLAECDAALFLVSADPPITAVEVAFLREVQERVPRLFFLLNKVDYLSDDEAVAATGFLRRVLAEQAGLPPHVPVYPVSARRGLAARERGDEAEWRASGCAGVARTASSPSWRRRSSRCSRPRCGSVRSRSGARSCSRSGSRSGRSRCRSRSSRSGARGSTRPWLRPSARKVSISL